MGVASVADDNPVIAATIAAWAAGRMVGKMDIEFDSAVEKYVVQEVAHPKIAGGSRIKTPIPVRLLTRVAADFAIIHPSKAK
jgi:hypothetical protein